MLKQFVGHGLDGYAPSKEVVLGDLETLIKNNTGKNFGILSFNKKYSIYPNFVLSEKGSIKEAATNLFTGLRWFEDKDVDLVLTEMVPNSGLGMAINDRLKRASIK